MKINELKVGDRVKFNWTHGDFLLYTGNIKKINLNWFYIEETNGVLCDWVDKNNIISKLEMLPIAHHKIRYKEIPIEKDNLSNLHPYICPQCHESHGLTGIHSPQEARYCQNCIDSWNKKETKIVLPETDMQFGCGKSPKEKYNWILSCGCAEKSDNSREWCPKHYSSHIECMKQKEKSAPKSFKYDFVKNGYSFWIPLDILSKLESNKIYTIEIKEKE